MDGNIAITAGETSHWQKLPWWNFWGEEDFQKDVKHLQIDYVSSPEGGKQKCYKG
jgi:hypothetical protein